MTKKAKKRSLKQGASDSKSSTEGDDSRSTEEEYLQPTGLLEIVNNINTFQRFFAMAKEVTTDNVDDVLPQLGDLSWFLGTRIQFFKQECEARMISCEYLGKFQFKCIELLKEFPDDRDALIRFNDFISHEFLLEFYFETIDRLEAYVKSQFDALPIETIAHAVGCFFREMGNVPCVPITTLRGPFRDTAFVEHLYQHDLIECVFWAPESGKFVVQDQVHKRASSFSELATKEMDADKHSSSQVHLRLSAKGAKLFEKVTKPLDGWYKKCAEYIENHPGKLYHEIAEALKLSPDYCRQEILPILEMKGFRRKSRKGWYPPLPLG